MTESESKISFTYLTQLSYVLRFLGKKINLTHQLTPIVQSSSCGSHLPDVPISVVG